MTSLKYMAICLAALTCTQTFCLFGFKLEYFKETNGFALIGQRYSEHSPVFNNTKAVSEYFEKNNFTDGWAFEQPKDKGYEKYTKVVINSIPTTQTTTQNPNSWFPTTATEYLGQYVQTIQAVVGHLYEWFGNSKQYQVTRAFEKRWFTLFGLLGEEKNIYYTIKNSNFKAPGTKMRKIICWQTPKH